MPLDPVTGPGFDSIPDEASDATPVGPDDWYDVTRSGEAVSGDGLEGDPVQSGFSAQGFAALDAWDDTRTRLSIGIAIMLVLGSILAVLVWRRRKHEARLHEAPNTAIASGIRRSIGEQMSTPLGEMGLDENGSDNDEPEPNDIPARSQEPDVAVDDQALEPEPEPISSPLPDSPSDAVLAADPSQIEVEVEISGSTRSLMTFTVDFRASISNRSGNAARDLNIAAKITSAQRGGANAAPIAGAQPIATIERVGPHQSHTVSGQLQLPLSEVKPIKQGSTRLFIPLLHVMLDGSNMAPDSRTFVLGTPSTTSAGRVHPLKLDGAPGGLPTLRAQPVKHPVTEGAPA